MKKKILLIIIVTILQTFTSFAQTNVYNVRLSDIINTTTPCGPTVRYQFVGAGDWGFRWTSSETSMAKSITVQLNYAINCNSNPSNNSVKLNGVNQAVQPTPGPYNCQCVPPGASPTVWTLNPSDYNSGGLNTVLLKSIGNSEGLNLLTGSTDVYARVTVKYSDTTIKGLATSIRNGDTTPAVADDTEFGSVAESAPLNHTFTIGNASTNNLTLTGTPSVAISGSNAFSIVTQPASTTIAGGSSNTFVVRFAPTCATLGVQTAIVSVATDDPDASIYKFTVQGTGIDNVKPTIVTNGDKNVNVNPGGCEATVTVSATATDNCSVGTPTGVRSDAKLLSDVYPVGTTTITWNVMDVNGNHGATAIQNVIVNDNILPTAISKNITVQLNASGSVTVNATQLNDGSTDNCGINNYKFAYGSVGTVCNVVGEGAFLSLTAPTASVFKNILYASYGNSTGTCGNFVTGSCNASNSLSVVSSALINKNSGSIYSSNDIFGDPCNGTQKRLAVQARYAPSTTETASLTFSCADVGTHNVVLFVTDSNGNVSTANATITVNDDTVPLITSNGDQNLNADAALCTTNVSVSASATDNCSVGTPTGVRSDAKLLSDVYPVGITTIAWNVKDSNGNDAVEVIQTVTVTENQIPVINSNGDQNVNADAGLCGAILVVSASATDNCSVGTPTGVRNDGKLLSDVYPVGSTKIKWNVKDSNGNNAVEVIQTVIVTDNILPTVITKNITVQLDATGNATIVASDVDDSSSDNCGIDILELDNGIYLC
ncbi:hypothetical protein KHA90_13365 [Flavobacterium psychroterrae]|uniref:SUEL-type lectin domain-containing protein n=1 Tax=Flavobacterium psychroterrae TaxID=2133767 RepID=A0ABS5PDT3_9FLAO|nr:hypothetical protein [Flavobacterium psychroterrae]MBS7232015.1 hypothetical protein [Flavobacterium psychroterrae]